MIAPVIYLDTPSETDSALISGVNALRYHLDATFGYQLYRPYRNTGPSAAMTTARFVSYASGSRLNVGYSADNDPQSRICGLLVSAPADDYYGWALCYGQGTVRADNDIAANAELTVESSNASPTVAGSVDDTAVTTIEHTLVGIAVTAVASFSSGDTLTMDVRHLL